MHEHFNHHNNNFQYSKLLTGLLSHPRSLNNGYQSFRERKLFNFLKENEIYSILYIINFPTQTFMYKAIYENLPFLMFINREWHKWFTPNYSALLEFMNKQKVLFYWDQKDEFLSYINKIMEKGEMGRKVNLDIIKYLEKDINEI